ncbi:cytidine/deoxycytidylate deaminase family protein [bacterium]|nr:cytidine/deoxycytidylate deaminase family protein [bacterium]
MSKRSRPNWDAYFIKMMEAVASRATCGRGRAGCVVVRNNHILSTGYVGSPPGLSHCDEKGHLMIKSTEEGDDSGKLHDHCVRTIHAEQNAIVHAARIGVALEGSTLYVKMEPCSVCARMIIAAGIKRVVCKQKYHTASLTRKMFTQVGIKLDVLNDKEPEYEE